jgi:hypothetical protein
MQKSTLKCRISKYLTSINFYHLILFFVTTCNYLSIPRRIFEIEFFWALWATPSVILKSNYIMGHYVADYLLNCSVYVLYLYLDVLNHSYDQQMHNFRNMKSNSIVGVVLRCQSNGFSQA